MNYYFVAIVGAFLPLALLLGLGWTGQPRLSLRWIVSATVTGVVAGVWCGQLLPTSATIVLGAALAQGIVLLAFLIAQRFSSVALHGVLHGLLVAGGAFRLGQDRNLAMISATHVVNTDLLLNLVALALGVTLLAVLAVQTGAMTSQRPRWRWALLILISVLFLVPLAGDVVLALLNLKKLALSSTWLSVSARAIDFGTRLPYVYPVLLLALAALFGWKIVLPRKQACAVTETIERRQALAAYRGACRLVWGMLAAIVLTLGGQWYWDAVASQPPSRSEAQRLALDSSDEIRLSLARFVDNKLHRFDWVADDGKVVRFFVINRFPDRPSASVVFDSCMLCGDRGYALKDNQVVCIACGVRLFLPSVGTAGGCNPIPMPGWKTEGAELVIPKESLEAGLKYFTTVEARQVSDPVGGEKLSSADAARTYEYGGKTYFFANNRNYDAFVADPEKYTKTKRPCCQGL